MGVVIGYVYGGEIDTLRKHSKAIIQVGGESALERNLERLKRKEIDAIIEDEYVAKYRIQQMGLGNKIKEAGTIGKTAGVYIGFPKILPNSEKYAKILSDGITKMKKTGRYQKILKNYSLILQK